MKQVRVALINMPFSAIYRPSLGLSLLQSTLNEQGFPTDSYYLNFDFAKRIGVDLYHEISFSSTTALMGEWVFAEALFGERERERDEEYLAFVRAYHGVDDELQAGLVKARQAVASYLEDCLETTNWAAYDVIGLTSVFQQNVAALAMARAIKARYPDKWIVMGGANVEGAMGQAVLQAFPFVDAICNGEGELAFGEFIRRLAADEPLSGIPGMALSTDLLVMGSTSGMPVSDMDALPHPDFDDYFEQLTQHQLIGEPENGFRMLFESARGCWWGAKFHCKFCGLSDDTLHFRSKSPDRVLDELTYLVNRYGKFTTQFTAVDKIIDMSYFKTLLPRLKENGLNLDLFYETKANLTRDQIRMFAEVGFTGVQPGIESLSSSILKLMDKGVTALQNVQTLKWCKEYGVRVFWNYLSGFPGEEPEEYHKAAELIPYLTHLHPPYGSGRLRLDRFSPYFERAAEHGVTNVRPVEAYRLVYSGVPEGLLHHLAYFFDFDYVDGRTVSSYTRGLEEALQSWRAAEGSELFYAPLGSQILLFDFRPGATNSTQVLTGPVQSVLEFCDAIRTRKAIAQYLVESGYPLSNAELNAILNNLVDEGMMMHEDDRFLSLPIRLGQYSPGLAGTERFLEYLNNHRKLTGQESSIETTLVRVAIEETRGGEENEREEVTLS